MDMPPASGDVLEWSALRTYRVSDSPHGGKREEERSGREELSLLFMITEVPVVQRAEISEPGISCKGLRGVDASSVVASHPRSLPSMQPPLASLHRSNSLRGC